MQIDFHYYAIYALCRQAGINKKCSKIIAYSSQQVDDAKYGHELNFKNGGSFKQILTAHKYIDIDIMSKEVGMNIYVPFHFLPGNIVENIKGIDHEQLVCRENSDIAKELIGHAIDNLNNKNGLHQLGIALHVYADTWAHQGFLGMMDPINRTSNLKTRYRVDSWYARLFSKLKLKPKTIAKLVRIIPEIGHGEVLSSPDIPYQEWSYVGYSNQDGNWINNIDRFLCASESIYKILSEDICKRNNDLFVKTPQEWEDVMPKLSEMYKFEGSTSERVENWKEKISNGFFNANEDVNYDDREWFREAIKVVPENYRARKAYTGVSKDVISYFDDSYKHIYIKNTGFDTSNWKLFHEAALEHRTYIREVLLPKYNCNLY